MLGLHQQVAKIYGLVNLNLKQRLYYFEYLFGLDPATIVAPKSYNSCLKFSLDKILRFFMRN